MLRVRIPDFRCQILDVGFQKFSNFPLHSPFSIAKIHETGFKIQEPGFKTK